jgi:hypothetical protein
MWPLQQLENLLNQIKQVDQVRREVRKNFLFEMRADCAVARAGYDEVCQAVKFLIERIWFNY